MQDMGVGSDAGSTRVLTIVPNDESSCRWNCTLCDGWFETLLKISRELRCVHLRLGGKLPSRPKGRLNFVSIIDYVRGK